MRRWLLAAALVGLTLTGNSTALACDYAPALSVDEVLAAGPGGTVPFFGRQVTLVGVVEHRVAATSPALIPITSARVGTTRVRSWGQPDSDMDHIPVEPPGEMPYFGGMGSSCGPVPTPPHGASILKALVLDGNETDRTSIGPESYTFHFPGGLTDETRHRLDETFGPAEVYDLGLVTQIRVAAGVWLPHAFAVLAALVVLVGTVRRVRAHRPAVTHP